VSDKSTKLTNGMRDSILSQIIKGAYLEKEKSLEEKRLAFSLDVYNDFYPEKIREQMDALPQGWLPERTEFKVQFGGDSSGVCRRMLKEPKRFQERHSGFSAVIKVYDNSHKFTKRHDEITNALSDLTNEVSQSKTEANAILYSCHTTLQLKTAWPEIAKYVGVYEQKSERTTAIVPMTTDLNKKLGLK